MAKKVQPVDILPDPSSSDDESQDQDSSSSDTDDEQPPQQSQNPQNQEPHESDDDDSETDSDETHNSPSASAFTVKPIVSKSPEPKTPATSKPDKATKVVSKNQESGKVKEGNKKRHTEVENVEKSKKSKGLNGEGRIIGNVEKGGSKSKGLNGEGMSVGNVGKSSKSKVLNGEGMSVGNVGKSSKGKGLKGDGRNVEKVEKEGLKGKSSNGEGMSFGKVEKGSKSKVLNGEGRSVGNVEKGLKSKKGTSGDDESGDVEGKKSLVKWSEEDEVKLLDGIIEFKAETGEDVNSKVADFYEFAKDLFSVNITKTQLYDKIRRLKKKFQDKWKNGEEPVFSRPQESKLFELSKKIWGSEGPVTDGNAVGNTSTPVEPVTGREHLVQEDTVMEERVEVTPDFWFLYPRLCASLESEAAGNLSQRVDDAKEYVKRIISGIGGEKAREMEDAWKAVLVMDHQLYARRSHLISKQAQAVSDAFNES